VSRYQKGKTNLDFTEARNSEWQWHQLGLMQVYTTLQSDNHASTPPLSFFTGRMPFLPPNQQRQSTEGQKSMSCTVYLWTLVLIALVVFPRVQTDGGTNTTECFVHAGADSKHKLTHPFNGPLSKTTRINRYQKGKTNLDFTEARDSE